MIEPCMPANESLRQMALDSLRIPDSHASEKLDRITHLTASYFGVPISLIDHDWQWFVSRFGLDAKETPSKISFCAHTILQQCALIVPNVANDIRFADNPLVALPYEGIDRCASSLA